MCGVEICHYMYIVHYKSEKERKRERERERERVLSKKSIDVILQVAV